MYNTKEQIDSVQKFNPLELIKFQEKYKIVKIVKWTQAAVTTSSGVKPGNSDRIELHNNPSDM